MNELYKVSLKLNKLINAYLVSEENNYINRLLLNYSSKKNMKNLINEIYALLFSIFPNETVSFYGKNACIEVEICNLYSIFEETILSNKYLLESVALNRNNLIPITNSGLYGISEEVFILKKIYNFLSTYEDYFNIIIINGSIGSRDYKPGWSDIDIFINLKSMVVKDINLLKKFHSIAIDLNRLIYVYNILQLHGVFYSTGIDINFMLNRYLPQPIIKSSQVWISLEKISVNYTDYREDSINYFIEDIYNSSRILLIKRRLSFSQKVMLLHRIFSFPFSFLQCLNHKVSKKDSFTQINRYNDIFHDIDSFYSDVNQFYKNWKVKKLYTIFIRYELSKIIDKSMMNKLFLILERSIVNNIDNFFENFYRNNKNITFFNYINAAKQYLSAER